MRTHRFLWGILLAALGTIPPIATGEGKPADAPAIARETGLDALGDPLPEGCLMRLGTVRLRHNHCLAFSPDGRIIASAGVNTDTGVWLWDSKTGKLIRYVSDPDRKFGWSEAMAFSPDGSKLVFGCCDGGLLLAEVSSGRVLFKHMGKEGIQAVAFAPDGQHFAERNSGQARLWKVGDSAVVKTFGTGQQRPGGMMSASTGPPTISFGPDGSALAFSPDGKLLAMGEGQVIHVWDVGTGRKMTTVSSAHGAGLRSLAFSAAGSEVISGGYRWVSQEEFGRPFRAKNVQVQEIRFWDPRTGKLVRELKSDRPEAGYGLFSLSADAKTLACGTFESVHLWDVGSGKSTAVIPNGSSDVLALSPDGKTVASSGGDSAIALWDVATGKRLLGDLKGHTAEADHVACSPDGSVIVSRGEDGRLMAWDAKTGMLKYQRDSAGFAMTMSPDGALVAAGSSTGRAWWERRNVIRTWKTQSGERVRDFGGPHGAYGMTHCLRFSRDGKLLAVAAEIARSEDDEIDVWEVATGRKVAEIRPREWRSEVLDMAFSADAKLLHVVWMDKVETWELASGRQLRSFAPHLAAQGSQSGKVRLQIDSALFSADAQRLFTNQKDAIVVWDVAAGKAISTVRLPGTDKGRYLGLSPDGRLLATAEVNYAGDPGTGRIEICAVARSGNVRLWQHDAGRASQAAEVGDGRVLSFAFSPNNKRLITGMGSGTVLVWDLEAAQ